uniref:Uncharacterized protein n=1 Tax=viral metagenome TaxID=1070528 RepID=A0A6C0EAX2_9ZZZZ
MKTLEDVIEKYNRYLTIPECVYHQYYEYVIILKKLVDIVTDENREVYDKKYARYTGNKFYVEKIFDVNDLEECLRQSMADGFEYVVGQEFICEKEYFLTIEPAYYRAIYYEIDYNAITDAEYKEWNDDGRLIKDYIYINGKTNGKFYKWHTNGILAEECEYKNNNPYGNWLKWYDNGNKKSDHEYDSIGCIRGTEWHDNKQTSLEFAYERIKGKRCLKKWLEWYKDGTKKSEEYGNGDKKIWFKNGKLQSHRYFDGIPINGLEVFEQWYENGNQKSYFKSDGEFPSNWEDNSGKYIEWFENGNRKLECVTINGGTYDEQYLKWYENGKLAEETLYNNGVRLKSIKWNEDGVIIDIFKVE